MPVHDRLKLAKLRGAAPETDASDAAADAANAADAADAATATNRRQTVQRLQVGLSGLAAMVLLVGLANIIQDRARVTEERSVPEAAPTVQPSAPPPLSDPLADAGVVPDLPAEPTPTQQPAIVPEQGDGTGD